MECHFPEPPAKKEEKILSYLVLTYLFQWGLAMEIFCELGNKY